MNAKKKRLGRGLDALLGGSDVEQAPKSEDTAQASAPNTLPIEKLQRGEYQPRTNMDQESLEELAASIKSQGIIQPILVRPIADDQYEIIAGERRWRAAQIAQLDKVPVLVRNIPDEATLAVALIENIQRENLNPVEEAVGLKRLMDEFDLTHEEMAKSVGRLVRSIVEPKKKAQKKSKSVDIRNLEESLAETLGANVSIEDKNGKGKLVIEYKSLDILDGILAHIK